MKQKHRALSADRTGLKNISAHSPLLKCKNNESKVCCEKYCLSVCLFPLLSTLVLIESAYSNNHTTEEMLQLHCPQGFDKWEASTQPQPYKIMQKVLSSAEILLLHEVFATLLLLCASMSRSIDWKLADLGNDAIRNLDSARLDRLGQLCQLGPFCEIFH